MSSFPAASYISNAARTEGEVKTALEDIIAAAKQIPGSGIASSTLTMASDQVTPPGGSGGIFAIDTEAAAASDNLAQIVQTNTPDGSLLLIRSVSAARVVIVKHAAGGTGQISLTNSTDFPLTDPTYWLLLKRNGTLWDEVFRSTKAGRIALQDARTATVATPLIVEATTSAGPAANIGTGIKLQAESADETPSDFGQLEFVASDVTAASEDTFFQVLLRVAGAALTAVYRFAATGAFNAIFTHANTADRTYTLPNSSDTLVGRATTDTLTNKTLSGAVVSGAAPATPTANVLYTDSVVKGWVRFQINGTIDDDLNVSSITDAGVGDWTVNWATAFANATYAVHASAATDSDVGDLVTIGRGTAVTASAVRITAMNSSTSALSDPTGTGASIHVIAIGDN